MEENPYKAPVEEGAPRRPRFGYLNWYGAVAGIAIATFMALAAIALLFG
jgi:hypothetical protein